MRAGDTCGGSEDSIKWFDVTYREAQSLLALARILAAGSSASPATREK